MTAPLFFVEPGQLAGAVDGSAVVLGGAEGRHAATVRRIRVGEQVTVTDGDGTVADTVVESVAPGSLTLRVRSRLVEPPPDPRFVLVQALAKGDRDEQAIEAATELGVDEVVAWQAARSVVVWRPDRAARSLGRWEAVVRSATKQSRRARVPLVSGPEGDESVIRRIGRAALALVLHEDAPTALAALTSGGLPPGGDVLLVVGPEGGISPDELRSFAAAGAHAVRLGANVLRSSSAGPAALAVLSAAGRWR